MAFVSELSAIEILDSRGRPTVKAHIRLAGGASASASVPSGASTGSAEALELRDGEARYGGLGVRKAVENVNRVIAGALVGKAVEDQEALDETMIALDGTPNKARLGANAILAVSIAFARAMAMTHGMELWEEFARIAGNKQPRLPGLTINLFSGGKHAGGQVEIQDVLICPVGTKSIAEGLEIVDAVYRSAEKLIARKYKMRSLKADEGGLAPPFESVEAMLDDATEAANEAGRDVTIAIDVASTHFHGEGRYSIAGKMLTSAEMIERISNWVQKYKIFSVEDGLAEEDWANWPALRAKLDGRAITLGDDFLCTNPKRIQRAIDAKAANALLLKVNQIGTLTEAARALKLARDAGWKVVVSARSGETEDNWLADLAVGWAGDFIKVGSVRQSERLAKYNRLLEIERGWRGSI